MMTIFKIIIASLVITVVSLVVFQFVDPNVKKTVVSVGDNTEIAEDAYSVSISGEITTKGTYLLTEGSTLEDLIAAAGGTTSNADILCYDESITLEKSASYYIAPIYDTDNVCSTNKIVKYNINTCTADDLTNISGIGSSIASNIISYRDENNTFMRLEDIMNVNGIGTSTFIKMRNYIRLRDA